MDEPEWDDDTRELVLAYGLHEKTEVCPACGGPTFLCQDQENQFAWSVPPPVRCHRTTALRTVQRTVTEATNPIPEALLWQVVLDPHHGPS